MKQYESQFRKLTEVGSVNRGKSKHRPRNAPELYGGSYPFIQTGDVKHTNFYITEYAQTYSEKGLAQSKLWQPGTLCITIAANIADTAILKIPACFPDSIIGFIPEKGKSEVRFIKYCLDTYKKEMQLISQGTTQDNLSQGKLLSLRFRIPDYDQQKKIAAILSAYDELIENNHRRIALLEKMAEEIYREWFVRLRFPGHEKVKKVKGVPEGWQQTKVITLTSYLKRGVAPQYDDFAEGFSINQKCIRDGKLDLSFARHQSRDVSIDRQIRFGDVLVNSTGEGTLGRVAQVLTQLSNCIVDSHVTIVRPKQDVPIHFFGMTLKAWEVHFSTMGRGATNQTELSPTVIGNIEVTLPSKSLQDVFETHAGPLFAQITYLIVQNERLTRIRDMLLPRLISGKLSVEHLDIQFPPGMEDRP
ncbi:MAG: restriction endonuclease subunit S [Proteobacteria bacterium]|nr:restriction endonuclease subunit S [Pseudomonadota bacterium]